MDLIFWWMLLLWLAGGIIYWLIRYRFLGRSRPNSTTLPVAHSRRLVSLPEYAAGLKRYRLLISWVTGLLTLGMLSGVLLSARPSTVSIITPTQQNRDIMLCLDASGSVLKEDTTLLDRFSTLVTGFSGQRFGLTLFNSSAVTIIPLNDDYQLTTQQLKIAAQAFKAQKGQTFTTLTNGTLAGFDSGTSLVSDGLISCMQHLGNNTAHRSESIILATDDEVNGTPVVAMTQAVAVAKQSGIHIYAIDPGVSDQQLAGDHTQLQAITRETGGAYYHLSDANAVDSIIGNINTQAAKTFVGLPQAATNDSPKLFLYAAIILTILAMVLLWRLEL